MSQASMNTNEIIISLIHKQLCLESIDLFRERNRFTSQPAVLMAEVQVMPFEVYCTDGFKINFSINTSLKDPGDAVPLVSLFDHLSITQLPRDDKLGFTRSASFSCSRIRTKLSVPVLKRLPISIKPVTHPYRPTTIIQPPLCFSNKWTSQGSLGSFDPEGKHQPIFFGKGNPDPDLALQSRALRRRPFFLTNVQRASNSTWGTASSFNNSSFTFSLCYAATRSQCLTVSSLTSKTSATPRRVIPLTRSLSANKTFSSGVRRS